jgi:hypothetical protein
LRGLADVAQHLVLDLHQIVGIEGVAVVKQKMGDGFRMRVERATAAKRLALLLMSGRGHWQSIL